MSERGIEPAPAPQKVTTATLKYHGTGGSLFGLMLINGLFTILTLGIYSFWAKNKLREFHYSHTEMDGDRFAYHGTGGELLTGAIKAAVLFLGLALVIGVAMVVVGGAVGSPGVSAAITLSFYALIGLLVPIAINGARRYRLSRSSWRGIRFSYHGRWQEYFALSVGGMFLSIVTLGLYVPRYQDRKQEYFVTHTRFGSEPFMYRGHSGELFAQYMKALLLTIPTLGLSWIWYVAFKHRYFWANTTMRGAQFRSTVSGRDLLILSLTNLGLTIITLGVAIPWVQTRTHAYFCESLRLRGTVDWATIEQRAQQAGSVAEGMADALDVDIGIG